MSRENGKKTKEKVIFQSFILFSIKPYDKVTFTDIEKATGLSRGAILYHFASKQEIFNAVVESSLLNRTVFLDMQIKDDAPLKSFIVEFVNECKETIKEMAKHGIKNINLAHYNIESQALYFYEQFNKLSRQMRGTEIQVWTNLIIKAQDSNEIRRDLDPSLLATLFLNTYYGHAFASAKEDKGCDVELLLKELLYLYHISSNK